MEELLPEVSQEKFIVDLMPRVGTFLKECLPLFGRAYRDPANFRIVDEFAFQLTNIPIVGPELTGRGFCIPYIDIAVRPELYTGPQISQEHPVVIPLPPVVSFLITKVYEISVEKLIRGDAELFAIPYIEVNIGDITVFVPEPSAHIRYFAQHTILNYTLSQAGEGKIREWFEKLISLRLACRLAYNTEAGEVVSEMIRKSIEMWRNQGWEWLQI